MSLATTIAASATIFALLRIYLHKIGFFYKDEEGYTPEIEEEHTENKNPRTGGNR